VSLDSAARPLPYDAALTGFDLPLVERPDSVLTRVLALVRAVDSTLFREVDGAHRGARGSVVLEMGRQTVWLPRGADAAALRAVEAVRQHLAESGRAYTALDARFAGWILVRRGKA
jgi:hypothetical protein